MAIIAHLAIYCSDLETMRAFYMKHFDARSNERYTNVKKGFHSYFLSFGESPMRLELMTRVDVVTGAETQHIERLGITHFAIQLDSKEAVNQLTDTLQKEGYRIVGAPRTTGDGYYESVVLDPEGNRVELVG
ncbi:MAG: VOC family protein [Saprospiraceae bacterium]